jgi:hypothetical protein
VNLSWATLRQMLSAFHICDIGISTTPARNWRPHVSPELPDMLHWLDLATVPVLVGELLLRLELNANESLRRDN